MKVGVNGGLTGGFEQNFSSRDHYGGITLPTCKSHLKFNATQSGDSSMDKQKDEIIQLAKLSFF